MAHDPTDRSGSSAAEAKGTAQVKFLVWALFFDLQVV